MSASSHRAASVTGLGDQGIRTLGVVPQVVVMCAIPQELELLRGELADRVDAGSSAFSGTIHGRPVVLAPAGIGKVNTAVVATQLIERFRPSRILFTGVAGGLDPALRVGDVVVGERTLHHDAGVFGDGGIEPYQAGHVPFFNPTDQLGYAPSEELLDVVRRVASEVRLVPLASDSGGRGEPPRITFGTILTGDQFVNSKAVRERLFRELGGAAVEMEGAAVAQTAEMLGVDCIVVRALSDLAGAESTLDFTRFLDQVAANSARLVSAVLRARA